MSISPDINILTTDELAQKEHLAYMRGVERGKFEASADRNASNGACEQKLPFKELLDQEAPRPRISVDPAYEAARDFLYGPGRSPGTTSINELAQRFRDFVVKHGAGKAANGGVTEPTGPTGEAVHLPAEVIDAVRHHLRDKKSFDEILLAVGKLVMAARRAAVCDERERIVKSLIEGRTP